MDNPVTLNYECLPGRVLRVLWISGDDVFTFSGHFAILDERQKNTDEARSTESRKFNLRSILFWRAFCHNWQNHSQEYSKK